MILRSQRIVALQEDLRYMRTFVLHERNKNGKNGAASGGNNGLCVEAFQLES